MKSGVWVLDHDTGYTQHDTHLRSNYIRHCPSFFQYMPGKIEEAETKFECSCQ